MHRFLISLIALLLCSTQVFAVPYLVVISRTQTLSNPQALATDYLIRLLEERSQGGIHVALQETSGSPLAVSNQQRMQLAMVSLPETVSKLPQLAFLQLPYLFRDRQHLYQFLASEAGRKIFQADRQPDFIPLAVWDLGFYQLITGTTDLPGELVAADSWQTFSNMQHNAVPSQDRLLTDLIKEQPQQTRQLILSNHLLNGKVLMVSRSFWDATPDDLKIIIIGAIKDATLYFRELAQQDELQSLAALRGTLTIHNLSPGQRNDWQIDAQRNYPHPMSSIDRQMIDIISNLDPVE